MVRIIPRLDIKGPNLVKGIHLEGLRVLGNPSTFAHHYYKNGADELFFQDVVASLYQRNSLNNIITKTAKLSFSHPCGKALVYLLLKPCFFKSLSFLLTKLHSLKLVKI